jgi:hypothetical protein
MAQVDLSKSSRRTFQISGGLALKERFLYPETPQSRPLRDRI